MTTQTHFIQSRKKYSYGNVSDTNFYALSRHFQELYSKKSITLREIITPHLTGAELLYYPTLTKYLRKKLDVTDYPQLIRDYKLVSDGESKTGEALVRYFCTNFLKAFEEFGEETKDITKTVEELVAQYGGERVNPVIDSIEKRYETDRCINEITINGIPWFIADGDRYSPMSINTLDLQSLLSIESDFDRIYLEDVILGTSFISVRQARKRTLKGRKYCYDLNISKGERP